MGDTVGPWEIFWHKQEQLPCFKAATFYQTLASGKSPVIPYLKIPMSGFVQVINLPAEQEPWMKQETITKMHKNKKARTFLKLLKGLKACCLIPKCIVYQNNWAQNAYISFICIWLGKTFFRVKDILQWEKQNKRKKRDKKKRESKAHLLL